MRFNIKRFYNQVLFSQAQATDEASLKVSYFSIGVNWIVMWEVMLTYT